MATKRHEGGSESLPMALLTSRVVITDKALVVEANRPPRSSLLSLGPPSPRCQLLKMMLQDGSLPEHSGKAMKDPSGMELVIRVE